MNAPSGSRVPRRDILRLLGDGKPVVRLDLDDALRAYVARTSSLGTLFTRAGFTPLEAEWLDSRGGVLDDLHFSTARQLGSCRMADDPARGVVDGDGEAHGCPGLFVGDGAAIPGALAVNPSLTIAANAERVAERVLRRYHAADAAALAPERAPRAAALRTSAQSALSLRPTLPGRLS